MIDRMSLAKVIAKRTMNVSSLAKLKREVAALLLAEGQTADVESLMRDVMAYRLEDGMVEATVISAYPLTAKVRADVIKELRTHYPKAKSVVLNEKLDVSVVGGLRIESTNEQLDLTVRSRLNTLKRLTAARNI